MLVLLAAAAGVVLWVRRDRSSAVTATVVLAAASDPGADPFVPVAANPSTPVALPPVAAGGAVTASVDPDSGARVVTGTTDRLYAGRAVSQQLYGGSGSLSACDPAAIAQFLAAHPDKAAAWASVRGIDPAGIADYLNTLTPVVLLHDTVVTNHGFTNGVATPVVSVLQAGTAVLVDGTGLPVVRCACGNPLSAPPPVELSTAVLQGTRWDGYDPDRSIVVTAGTAIAHLVVIDLTSGQDLTLPLGSIPTSAPASSTIQVPTTSSVDTGECVLDLSWPAAAPGWIEPLDPSFTCQQMIDQWRRNEQWPGERGGTMFVVDFGDGWYCTGVHWDPSRPRTNAVGSCDLNGRRFNVYQGAPGVQTTVPTDSSTTPELATTPELTTTPESTATPESTTGSATAGVTDTLVTPSQNIECARRDGQFACTIKEFDFDLGDDRCPGARGPIVRLDATGEFHASSCRGDFFEGISWPDPTPYGTSEQFGDVSCDVEQTGLTCTNDQGHGFALSRAGISPL